MRDSARPASLLRQKETPRPELRRGAAVSRSPSSRRYIHSVSPGVGVDRYDGAAKARGGVEHAVRHERRDAVVELRSRAEVVGLPAPRDSQLADVGAVDLIQRRIAGAAHDRHDCSSHCVKCRLPSPLPAPSAGGLVALTGQPVCTTDPVDDDSEIPIAQRAGIRRRHARARELLQLTRRLPRPVAEILDPNESRARLALMQPWPMTGPRSFCE